jgi:putative transposase
MVEYIDQYKHMHGVEPICDALKDTSASIAPSTYYAARARAPSARSVRDGATLAKIKKVHQDNYGVYGARKINAQLRRDGHQVARCTVERLMRASGIRGISRAKNPRTTIPAPAGQRPQDLVKRAFTAPAPDCLWVADIERHEALLNRAVVRGHRLQLVAASRKKLRAARSLG